MEHVLSLSYGKDSMACLGAIEHLGWPLDRIETVDVWATQTIPAEYPPVAEFKARADELIKERYGITVEHISLSKLYGMNLEKISYEDIFYYVLPTGKYAGDIKGFPLQRGPWCNHLKTAAVRERERGRGTVHVQFVISVLLPMNQYALRDKSMIHS